MTMLQRRARRMVRNDIGGNIGPFAAVILGGAAGLVLLALGILSWLVSPER